MKVAIELFAQSDIISLHCPLTPENKHIISDAAIARMKTGVMLINTSRGALLDTLRDYRSVEERQDQLPRPQDIFTRRKKKSFLRIIQGLILSDDVFARLLALFQTSSLLVTRLS